ncbi:MAG: ATP-binding protein, partial [Gemmatimonadales bacterium]
QAPEAITVSDVRSGRYVEVNEAAQRLFGMSREELLAVGPADVSAPVQPGETPLQTAFRGVVETALAGEIQECEWVYVRSDGALVPCDIRLMRVPGRSQQIRATIIDRSDRPTFAQVTVLESLARGASLETVLGRLITLLESQLRGGCGAVFRWDADAQRFLVLSAPSMPADFAELNRTTPFHPGMPFVARTRAGMPQATADVFEDPDWEGLRPQATQIGYRAVWSWPFNDSSGDKLGVVVMHFSKSRLPTPAQRALVGVAASLASLAIQRDDNAASLRQAEEQLREAQKMDAVGRLAGGIAHDFNNLLTVIASASSLLDGRLPDDPEAVEELEMIRGATDQAAGLTRQLLAFSRRQPWQTRALDLNDAIRRLDPMLHRLVGATNRILLSLDAAIGRVRADEIQVQQVLINLVVNARDAMVGGGTIRLTTRAHVPGRTDVSGNGLPTDRGEWVVLDVDDDGAGFQEGMEDKIFEPFFTTKPAGQGTGLGLATVYGIVRQAGGSIQASNRAEGGARVRVILPTLVTDTAGAPTVLPVASVATDTPGTRLLLVEDEATLRRVVARLLRNSGYVVEEAESVEQARMLLANSEPFKLVITDVVMPGASGRELGEYIAAEGGPPVLYTSGYTEDTVFLRRIREEGLPFLAKPFTVDELLAAVRPLVPSPRA